MLDQKTIDVVKSTIPAIVQAGPEVTKHFYKRMLSSNPSLQNVFNMAHQRDNTQPKALFDAVCAYAANIENPAQIKEAVERIAQKHVSVGITPEQYSIVGENLLGTIDELLSPGKEVLEAWAKAYGVLADIFIHREAEIYTAEASQVGGWKGTREFRVVKKTQESSLIVSFVLEPVDGKPILKFKPGQYISIYVSDQGWGHRAIRQYSLPCVADGKYYRIAVKQEDKGEVSPFLHANIQEGDIVHLSAPAGDFFMDIATLKGPVALISAGVGQTPILSMLKTLHAQSYKHPIHWLHCARSQEAHAFDAEVREISSQMPQLTTDIWYSQAEGHPQGVHAGRMDLDQVKAYFANPDIVCFMCGPREFMRRVKKQLLSLGVNPEHIHYELFGSFEDI